MDITQGFKIDKPDIFVPWGISINEFHEILPEDWRNNDNFRKVTKSYYCISGAALGLESTDIGFHFKRNQLNQIELFDPNQKDMNEGFKIYQSSLIKEFGTPARTIEYDDLPPSNEWKFGKYRILHFAQERFGPETHLRFLAPGSDFPYDPFSRL